MSCDFFYPKFLPLWTQTHHQAHKNLVLNRKALWRWLSHDLRAGIKSIFLVTNLKFLLSLFICASLGSSCLYYLCSWFIISRKGMMKKMKESVAIQFHHSCLCCLCIVKRNKAVLFQTKNFNMTVLTLCPNHYECLWGWREGREWMSPWDPLSCFL